MLGLNSTKTLNILRNINRTNLHWNVSGCSKISKIFSQDLQGLLDIKILGDSSRSSRTSWVFDIWLKTFEEHSKNIRRTIRRTFEDIGRHWKTRRPCRPSWSQGPQGPQGTSVERFLAHRLSSVDFPTWITWRHGLWHPMASYGPWIPMARLTCLEGSGRNVQRWTLLNNHSKPGWHVQILLFLSMPRFAMLWFKASCRGKWYPHFVHTPHKVSPCHLQRRLQKRRKGKPKLLLVQNRLNDNFICLVLQMNSEQRVTVPALQGSLTKTAVIVGIVQRVVGIPQVVVKVHCHTFDTPGHQSA